MNIAENLFGDHDDEDMEIAENQWIPDILIIPSFRLSQPTIDNN
jgi:hypothetical protein